MSSIPRLLLTLTALVCGLATATTLHAQPTEEGDGDRLSPSTFSALELRGIGPALRSGRISDIVIHPRDRNTWYVAAGSGSLAAVKKLTRAGMGRCQGRYFAGPVNAILGGSAGSADDDFFAPRPPLKPVPIGLLAGWTGAPPEPRDLLAGVAEDGRAGPEPG